VITGAPGAKPETTPDVPIEAIAVLLLLHVPPAVILESVVVSPVQSPPVPEIAKGVGFTRIVVVTWQPTAI
jgi:hypothetical protein